MPCPYLQCQQNRAEYDCKTLLDQHFARKEAGRYPVVCLNYDYCPIHVVTANNDANIRYFPPTPVISHLLLISSDAKPCVYALHRCSIPAVLRHPVIVGGLDIA